MESSVRTRKNFLESYSIDYFLALCFYLILGDHSILITIIKTEKGGMSPVEEFFFLHHFFWHEKFSKLIKRVDEVFFQWLVCWFSRRQQIVQNLFLNKNNYHTDDWYHFRWKSSIRFDILSFELKWRYSYTIEKSEKHR